MSKLRRKSKPSAPRAFDRPADGEIQSTAAPTPERIAKGGLVREPIYATLTDGRGEPLADQGGRAIRTVQSFRRRDADADLAAFLRRRFPRLGAGMAAAAVLFETDWHEASLEPRITSNPQAIGGGRGPLDYAELPQRIVAARTRVHQALGVLRLAGEEPVRVVEHMVLRRTTVQAAGAPAYVRDRDASVHVAAMLEVALALLERHYAREGRLIARAA